MKKENLLGYQDIPRRCIKCGMDGDLGIGTRYVAEERKNVEYLIRTCCRCGYYWHTKTKETK